MSGENRCLVTPLALTTSSEGVVPAAERRANPPPHPSRQPACHCAVNSEWRGRCLRMDGNRTYTSAMNESSQKCVAMKRVIFWISCLVVGALILVTFWLVRSTLTGGEYAPRSYTNDPAFAVITSTFTHGTNHTMNSGNAMLGKLNAARISARKRPFTRDRQWSMATTQDTSVLWVSFTHSNALTGRAPPLMTALLSSTDRGDELITMWRGWSEPKSHGYTFAFTLPSRATNYSGWRFHLVATREGTKVITFEL